MNCLPFEDKIAEYIDGELDGPEAQMVEAHLRSCPACSEFADRLESDRTLLRMQPPESAEVDFASLRRQIRERIVEERRGLRLVPAMLIAASILIAVAITAIRFGASPVPPPVPTIAQVRPVPAPPVQPHEVEPQPAPTPSSARHHRVHSPSPAPVPQADPALEEALREFLAAEKAPAVSPLTISPIEIRIVTSDPNVVLILLPEANGVSNE